MQTNNTVLIYHTKWLCTFSCGYGGSSLANGVISWTDKPSSLSYGVTLSADKRSSLAYGVTSWADEPSSLADGVTSSGYKLCSLADSLTLWVNKPSTKTYVPLKKRTTVYLYHYETGEPTNNAPYYLTFNTFTI